MQENEALRMDIVRVVLAHEFVLHDTKRCTYPAERGTYGLVYVIEGEGEYRFFSGKRYTATPGTVMLLSTHTAYTIKTKGTFRHYTVNFLLHGEGRIEDYFAFRPADPSPCALLFEEAATAWKRRRAGHEMQTIGCVYKILSLLFAEDGAPVATRRLRPAKAYIDENYALPLTVGELAALCHMSDTHFRREWQRAYGETVMEYRDRVRLLAARAFLAGGYLSVTETAEKCGFADVSYFVRFFKKKTGITPAVFRRGNATL